MNLAKVEAKLTRLEKTQEDAISNRLKEEKKINEERAARLAKKKSDLEAEKNAAAIASVTPADEAAETQEGAEAEQAAEPQE